MMGAYDDWIAANAKRFEDVYGKCADLSRAMQKAFPELRLARGIYDCPVWGERTHWWLVAPGGDVVDPTASQFPSKGIGEYRELKEGDRIPSGVCMDCGDTVYDGATFCSDACKAATLSYLNGL
jgi:hypothetical protein